jgi:amino acid transporter
MRLERTRWGVPHRAVGVSWLFGFLAFLSLGTEATSTVRDPPAHLFNDADVKQTLGRITSAWSTAILIVYGLNCLAYLNFYKESVPVHANQLRPRSTHRLWCRINAIAAGTITSLGDLIITPQTKVFYDRTSTRYPWRTRGQWPRAVYGSVFCSLLIVFFGWRTLVPPFMAADFVATYISVRCIPFLDA